jgi:DNA-binding transcriptional MerR regulator
LADRPYLSIGEVLALLRPEFPDLTISKIRFLESQGLLDPERTPSGYRKFYEPDIERLRWVLRQQREQYLPLKVIKGRLGGEGDEDDDADAGDVPPDAARHPAAAATNRGGSGGGGGGGGGGGRVSVASATQSAPVTPLPAGGTVGPSPVAGEVNPLQVVRTGVSMTFEELEQASGLRPSQLQELERFGLLAGRVVGGTPYYDEEALIVANLAAGFMRFGVEARHLRMYKTAAEREASFFEQLVMPLLKQRNPRSRREAMDTLVEMGKLGQGLRAAMLRAALRDHTAAP